MSTVSSFFEVNGIPLYVTDDEFIEIGMVLASDEMKYDVFSNGSKSMRFEIYSFRCMKF